MAEAGHRPITVGTLIRQLQAFDSDAEVQFGSGPGGLEFFQVRKRGPNVVQIEFNQNVWRDTAGGWHVD